MILKKLRSKTALIKIETEEKSSNGIYYPEDNVAREIAEVIQVADDITLFQKGDKIIFKTWATNRYEFGGEKFSIIDEQYVDGVI